jgi:ABC-2 type transport system ATP-binding protein
MDQEHAIIAEDVRKNYRQGVEGAGLNGFNLRVNAGTVCGLLGPNGAGKTTTVRVLATLLQLQSGRARVAGYDVSTQGHAVRENIGLVGQYAAVDDVLTGQQNLELWGRLRHLGASDAKRRAEQLMEQFDLRDAANVSVAKYSGGMRRRLDLAASLVVAPRVLFVDEPTTGLDPASRREVWNAIRELVRGGTTVLLTTQYLEEADHLADQIALLLAGTVVAQGTPTALKQRIGTDRLEVHVSHHDDWDATLRIVQHLGSEVVDRDEAALMLSVPVAASVPSLLRVAAQLHEQGIEPADLRIRRPSLDEVFLHITRAPATSTIEHRSEVTS